MNDTLKRHLISAAITFVTVFSTTVGVMLGSGALDANTLTTSAVAGVLVSAVRAAVKAAAEGWLGLNG